MTSARGTLKISRRGQKGSILLVAFDRPRVKNAVNDDVYEDLIEILHESASDDSISALVLTGTGPYFSSGADLKANNFHPKEGTNNNSLHKPLGRFISKLIDYPKILAAAVNGPAVGIGTTLLLHCDLVYCSTTATFWTPFSRIALVPELCSSVTFPSRMGLPKANEFFLLGKKIDAATAVDWNLCSRVVENVDQSGDPFHPQSLANQMCDEIDERLLSLPLGEKTAETFVAMVRGRQRSYLHSVCRDELSQLAERVDSGQVAEAASHLFKDRLATPRSKL